MAFCFAHISDLHLPPLPAVSLAEVCNKRVLGFLSWHRKRKFRHRQEVVAALLQDLAERRPDRICITGDITNLGLPREFVSARVWLNTLAQQAPITLVPGNHDAYVESAASVMQRELSDWLPLTFPAMQEHAGVAFIGVSTAIATAPGLATGCVGAEQRAALAECLRTSAHAGLYRVVLLHHPIGEGIAKQRKHLVDREAVRAVLRQYGAELVLHGHGHQPVHYTVPAQQGPIPVYGAGSASLLHEAPQRSGHYHLFTLRDRKLEVEHRYYDSGKNSFVAGASIDLTAA